MTINSDSGASPVPNRPWMRHLSPLFVAGCLAIILSLGYVLLYVLLVEPEHEAPPQTAGSAPDPTAPYQGPRSTPFICPGIVRPPTLAADQAGIPDETEVLGVSAGGKHRAYRIEAFSAMTKHVVNDLLGDVPVTVTHCNRSNGSRVFTSPERGAPLDIWTGGIIEGRLLLRLEGGGFYLQETGKPEAPQMPTFPYSEYPYERTTWGAWKKAHPDTDIYCGDPTEPARPDGKPAGPAPRPGRAHGVD